MKPCLCAVAVLGLVAGCARPQSYFERHPGERAAVLRLCRDGMVRREECQNAALAKAAADHADAQRIFREMSEGR